MKVTAKLTPIAFCFSLLLGSGCGGPTYTQPEKNYALLNLEYKNIGSFPDDTEARLSVCNGAGESCKVIHCATVGASGADDYACKRRLPAGNTVTLKPFVKVERDQITSIASSPTDTWYRDKNTLSCGSKPITFTPVEGRSYTLEFIVIKDMTNDQAQASCTARLK